MKAFVGITDGDWYELLASKPGLEEVNFWQPSGARRPHSLEPGDLFLFKLHAPRNAIVGGGFFVRFTPLPVSLAWDAFEDANGARTYEEMRQRIERYRRPADPYDNYTIGCNLLVQPFFIPESRWVAQPPDWSRNIVVGKTYDPTTSPGRELLVRVRAALGGIPLEPRVEPYAVGEPRRGQPTFVLPRLGQGSFRVIVTDAYERRCAVTGEKVLPVLEAAHIRPFARGGAHRLDNGLLLRRDLHTLFDRGYMTVTPDLRLEVSRRIREEFENGREYYKLDGSPVRPPALSAPPPSPAVLEWHNETVYRR